MAKVELKQPVVKEISAAISAKQVSLIRFIRTP